VIAGYTSVVNGGPGRDVLKSEIGSPRLFGGPGDDLLQIGLSTPDADGGEGIDSVSFWFGDQPVRVNLAREKASSPGAGSMRIVGVEDVEGTAYADVIRGNSAGNVLRGFDGDDRIYGQGGRDRAEGGSGRDICVAEVRVSC
jgi:serralysin